MKQKLRIRTSQERKEYVEQWEKSNLPAREWCELNKIAYSTFYGWIRNLQIPTKTLNKKEKTHGFIELPEESIQKTGLTLSCQGVSIHLDSEFEEGPLSRVILLLKGLSC
jgi:hypothetical protein